MKNFLVFTLLLFMGCKENNKLLSNFNSLSDSLGLDSTCVFIPYDKSDPHYNSDIKALFYIPLGQQDTFYYAISQNDSIFLWAIVKGKYTRLIQDF